MSGRDRVILAEAFGRRAKRDSIQRSSVLTGYGQRGRRFKSRLDLSMIVGRYCPWEDSNGPR
jgi:hypothetical protein